MEEYKSPMGLIVIEMMKSMTQVLVIRAAQQTDVKLTAPQFGLLFAISEEKEEVILKDMAEKMGKDKSSIMRMIDLLEKKELVRRVSDRYDRRKNQLLLTKKGERFIVEFRKIESLLNNELLEGLSDIEIQSFYKVVNQIKVKSDQLQTLIEI